MRHFSELDIMDLASIMARSEPGERFTTAQIGAMGGIKRRARTRAVVEFCRTIKFEDISLHGIAWVMRELFGSAVSHQMLLAWATPGRTASDRVDFAKLAQTITADMRSDAQRVLVELSKEWAEAKKMAAAMAWKASSKKTMKAPTVAKLEAPTGARGGQTTLPQD